MRVLKYFLLSLIETRNDGNGMITVIKRISREKYNLGTKGKIFARVGAMDLCYVKIESLGTNEI